LPAKRTATTPALRVTNADLAEKITGLRTEIVPRLERIEGLAAKAGLNGFGADIHDFFEQRAEEASARKWLSRKLRPIARFKVIVALVGFVASVGWAIAAVLQIVQYVHPHH